LYNGVWFVNLPRMRSSRKGLLSGITFIRFDFRFRFWNINVLVPSKSKFKSCPTGKKLQASFGVRPSDIKWTQIVGMEG